VTFKNRPVRIPYYKPLKSTNVDYGKLIIGIDQSQDNYRKCLIVVKEKGVTVMRCLYFTVFAISSSIASSIFLTRELPSGVCLICFDDHVDRLHRPAFLQLLQTFLKILAKCIDFLGAESKTDLTFSLSRTISPKSALSIISGMCTPG
jgi:hypothetical protein